MKRDARYAEHLDTLLALVSYLGLTGWRSRSPNGLARDLGLDEPVLIAALEGFPGLFRRGMVVETDVGPQHPYTLHARYALRRPRPQPVEREHRGFDGRTPSKSDPTPAQDGQGEELDADTLRALLDFVAQEARAEREGRQHRTSQLWVGIGVAVAAVASVVGAVIQAYT